VRRGERNWSVQIRIRGYQPATGTFTALDERYLSLPVMASTSC
jgi:hypothetical protein